MIVAPIPRIPLHFIRATQYIFFFHQWVILMAETESLVLEILRRLQADMSDLKQGQRSIREELISVRQHLHAMQGDLLRQETDIAGMLVKLDRIHARLDLTDA